MDNLGRFVERMKRVGVYLEKVNGRVVEEQFFSHHCFTLGFQPIKNGGNFEFTDIKYIFEIIRKYK
jgi:hypothetical protein